MTTDEGVREPALAAEGLSVRHGQRRLLDDVTFAVPPGSVFALLGRNGSGKTSLVRCLLGQQKPGAGRALLFGQDAWKHRRQAMNRIGVLPEEPDAPPGMTARQLSDFCRRLYTRWDAAAVEVRLSRFDVPKDTPFARLSRGERGASIPGGPASARRPRGDHESGRCRQHRAAPRRGRTGSVGHEDR